MKTGSLCRPPAMPGGLVRWTGKVANLVTSPRDVNAGRNQKGSKPCAGGSPFRRLVSSGKSWTGHRQRGRAPGGFRQGSSKFLHRPRNGPSSRVGRGTLSIGRRGSQRFMAKGHGRNAWKSVLAFAGTREYRSAWGIADVGQASFLSSCTSHCELSCP